MANSSDWLGALGQPALAPPASAAGSAVPQMPGWLALLDTRTGEGNDGGEGFRAASPFGGSAARHYASGPAPEPAPEPAPDPAAAALSYAFADGEAAGRAAAEAEAAAHAAHQRALRLNFRALDEAAMGVLADDLAATVLALCDGALAGAGVDRDALLARCHAAAQRIGGAAESLTMQLHPDDAAMLGGDALAGWRVTPEPALERGSLVVVGAQGSVSDGPAEWRRAIAAALRG